MSRPANRPSTAMTRSNRPTWRPTTAAAAAVLALGALTACSDDDASGYTRPGTVSADETPESSAGADASGPAEGEELAPEELTDLYAAALTGLTTAEFTMEIDDGRFPQRVDGVADFSADPPEMRMTISDAAAEQEAELVLSDGGIYLQTAPRQHQRWDLDDPAGPFGGLGTPMDPRALLEGLESATTGATYVGRETTDAARVNRYSVTVDNARLEGTALGRDAVAGESAFDLWFDQQGLFRRMEGYLGSPTGNITLSYDRWGKPVDIGVPPRSQVTDAG